MESSSNEFNRKLVHRMFGKLALETFLISGKYPKFQSEKNVILEFITFHLKITDKINLQINNKNPFLKQICEVPKPFENSGEFAGFENDKNCFNQQKSSSNVEFDGIENIEDDFKIFARTRKPSHFELNRSNELNWELLKMYKVKEKYANHLNWLRQFCGEHSPSFRSFEKLVRDAHSIDDFQKLYN